MNLNHIHHVLTEAKKITNHTDYVIIGSLTALGLEVPPPDEMVRSIDVDMYPKDDPARAGEIAAIIGQGSAFEDEFGYYVDAPVQTCQHCLMAGRTALWFTTLVMCGRYFLS